MKFTQDQIDNIIDQWHRSDSHVELHEYLGWSLHDYSMWVLDPTFIPESNKMNTDDVYHDLAVDLVSNCGLNMFTARKVVDFLTQECHIDYDALKEHYLGEEDEV